MRERMPDYPPEFDDEIPVPEEECEAMLALIEMLRETNRTATREPVIPDSDLERKMAGAQASAAAALWFIASKLEAGR